MQGGTDGRAWIARWPLHSLDTTLRLGCTAASNITTAFTGFNPAPSLHCWFWKLVLVLLHSLGSTLRLFCTAGHWRAGPKHCTASTAEHSHSHWLTLYCDMHPFHSPGSYHHHQDHDKTIFKEVVLNLAFEVVKKPYQFILEATNTEDIFLCLFLHNPKNILQPEKATQRWWRSHPT